MKAAWLQAAAAKKMGRGKSMSLSTAVTTSVNVDIIAGGDGVGESGRDNGEVATSTSKGM